MDVQIRCDHHYFMELRTEPNAEGSPLHHEEITQDIADLVDETFVRGVLAEQLPESPDKVLIDVAPIWLGPPLASRIQITLQAATDGHQRTFQQRYAAGRWVRRSVGLIQQLRDESTLAEDETAYPMLLAESNGKVDLRCPPLQPPQISDQSLEGFGVKSLEKGSLTPDRPVLVNQRMVEEILQSTEAAGACETGGGTLGKTIRVPEPLPGTQTRIVTILSASVVDPRHAGDVSRFTFSPDALAEADEISHLRGLGESVITAFHTHGWGTSCGNCNQSEACPLTPCTLLSVQDYEVLESLFPSKATLMPIAGRKLGAKGRHPVLEIHAWRGGQ